MVKCSIKSWEGQSMVWQFGELDIDENVEFDLYLNNAIYCITHDSVRTFYGQKVLK